MSSAEFLSRLNVGAYHESRAERSGRFTFRYILSDGKVRA